MIVPVSIRYSELEELCYHDRYEGGVVCDDLNTSIEIDAEEVTFERADLEVIVHDYLDDIIDIIINDRRYRDVLFKKLNSKNVK